MPIAIGIALLSTAAYAGQETEFKKSFKLSSYVHFQWLNSEKGGGDNDAFSMRRIRIGGSYQADPKTRLKISFDFANGGDDLDGTLKDAILYHDASPDTTFVFGQFSAPVGYEIARSSSRREFPERSKYNRTFIDGERIRGAMVEKQINETTSGFFGLANALSIKDDEIHKMGNGTNPGGHVAVMGGVRFQHEHGSVGISGLFGKRPEFDPGGNAVAAPEIDRHLIYVDADCDDLFGSGLFGRAELMTGRDRVPGKGGLDKPVLGWHVMVGTDISERSKLFVKVGDFDRDTGADFDNYREYGIGVNYSVSNAQLLSLAYLMEEDAAKDNALSTWTLRYQFKF